MPPLTRLRLLGPVQIEREGRPVRGFESHKALALLGYLIAQERPLTRAHLADLFWPDKSEARARGNLRRVLHNLAALLPDCLAVERDTVALCRPPDYWLDLVEFEALRGQNTPAALAAAVELYRDEFMAGLFLDDAPDFEIWLVAERERWRGRVAEVLRALIAHHTGRGEYSEALRFARRLLALDPWREEAHRELMRLLALSGQRDDALAQYEACRRILARELDVETDAETAALFRRIRDGALAPRRPSPAVIALPFLGRAAEHAACVRWWEATQAGGGRLLLVEGEAGVGKTRLAEEVLRYLQSRGVVVLRGRCYEFGGGLPYQPIAEALRAAPADVALPLATRSELARLLPEWRADAAAPAPPADEETGRLRLFTAIAHFLRELGRGAAGVCLFLDDLHWADPSTVDLVHYLVSEEQLEPRDRVAQVALLAAYRPEEIGPGHPLTQLRQALSRDHRVERVRLPPLSAAVVAGLADTLIGADAAANFGPWLYRESEGNPFVLTEVLYALQEQGVLRPAADAWRLHGSLPEAVLTTSVQDVILQRVERMSAAAQELLALAAVIGRQFDAALLRAAAPAAELPQAMAEWDARRLVEGTAAACDFTHDKIRAAVYQAMPAAQRVTGHRRVAEALEALHTQQTSREAIYDRLAYHYEQAGEADLAVVYLALAAARAAGLYAHTEALDYGRRALALLPADDARRSEIRLQQARSLRFLSRYNEAIAACQEVIATDRSGALASQAADELSAIYRIRRDYEKARAWAAEAQRLESTVGAAGCGEGQAAQAWLRLAEIEREQGNLAAAQALFDEALALYRRMEDRGGMACCLEGLGKVWTDRGVYDIAQSALAEALALYRNLGNREHEAACLQLLGTIHWRRQSYAEARDAFGRSLEICRAIGDRAGEAAALNGLGLAAITQGDDADTRRCWEESVALFRQSGLSARAAAGLHNLGILCLGQGDYPAAQRYLEEGLALDRAAGVKASEALDLGWLGRLHWQSGRYAESRRCLEAALALDQELGGGAEEVWHLIWLGAVLYELGDLAGAEERVLASLRLIEERGTQLGFHEMGCLTVLHLAAGRGDAALAVARAAQARADQAPGRATDAGAASALLGMVYGSALIAPTEDPTPHFERALALMADAAPFEQGQALRRYGAYLLRNGQRTAAREQLAAASAIFQRLGAQGELDKVHHLLVGADEPRLRW